MLIKVYANRQGGLYYHGRRPNRRDDESILHAAAPGVKPVLCGNKGTVMIPTAPLTQEGQNVGDEGHSDVSLLHPLCTIPPGVSRRQRDGQHGGCWRGKWPSCRWQILDPGSGALENLLLLSLTVASSDHYKLCWLHPGMVLWDDRTRSTLSVVTSRMGPASNCVYWPYHLCFHSSVPATVARKR